MNRRSFMAASAAVGLTVGSVKSDELTGATKNRIKQSVCHWCYGGVKFDDLARFSAQIGIKGMDLVEPKDWATLKKLGLVCSMTPSGSLSEGLSHKENHKTEIGL